MAQRQYYGMKYPFTANDNENYYVDICKTTRDKAKSMLMHLLFTPKNQRIRNPQFGTDLIKYIFENNDSATWSSIKSEIQLEVKRFIPNVSLNNVTVLKSEDDEHEIFVRIDYSVTEGNTITNDSLVTRL